MRTRSIVILISSILFIVFAVVGIAIWLIWRILHSSFAPPPTPALLKEPRIVLGANVLTKQPFLQTSFLGEVTRKDSIGGYTDISVGEWDGSPGLDVIVAGKAGAYLLDAKGTKRLKTMWQFRVDKVGPFEHEIPRSFLGDVKVVDMDGDGKAEYLARGSIDGAALFDHTGRRVWEYGYQRNNIQDGFLQDVTAGDLDGDGIAELIVSWNGIRIFDKDGNKLVQKDEEFGASQVEVIDTDGDGKKEIVSGNSSLRIRNAKGELIKELELPGYFNQFFLLERPGTKKSEILVIEDGTLYLINFEGIVVNQFPAPLSKFYDTVQVLPDGHELHGTSVYKARAVWVKLDKDQPEYLAVITNFAALDRGVFDVFDSKGQLIYQEVIGEDCNSIALLPSDNTSHPQQLLVGGESTVWRYGKQ